MTHKVHPKIFRIGFAHNWKSRWFGDKKNFSKNLAEDSLIRIFIEKRFPRVAIDDVEIEKSSSEVKIIIQTGRPGLVIGRGGEEVEKIRKELAKKIKDKTVKIEIQEISNPETSASTMASTAAEQIEKRMPYRRVMKQTVDKIIHHRDVKGVKIMVKGRLNGSEIARSEWMSEGKIPLQTLRANVDYAHKNAYTTYGIVSVKVWIYKGESFNH